MRSRKAVLLLCCCWEGEMILIRGKWLVLPAFPWWKPLSLIKKVESRLVCNFTCLREKFILLFIPTFSMNFHGPELVYSFQVRLYCPQQSGQTFRKRSDVHFQGGWKMPNFFHSNESTTFWIKERDQHPKTFFFSLNQFLIHPLSPIPNSLFSYTPHLSTIFNQNFPSSANLGLTKWKQNFFKKLKEKRKSTTFSPENKHF